MQSISTEDFKVLKSILDCEVNRYERNPTPYYSNLVRRAIAIISEHVSESAKPVDEVRAAYESDDDT